MSKLRVGLVFGGRSVEHEVSIASATSILKALDPTRYEPKLIGIDPQGRWHLGAPGLPPEASLRGEQILPPLPGTRALAERTPARSLGAGDLDVIFPIVHGTDGEDGRLQGLLELAGVPYVGAGLLGSALQMDKEVSRRLLAAAGLPVVEWRLVQAHALHARREAVTRQLLEALPPPVFVKPANSGSSVGISRVATAAELAAALDEAARYDGKILVERAVDAREIEVAVLGNESPEASVPGEIRPRRPFYDYEAKYVDEETELLVPAPLEEGQAARARALALEAFTVVEGAGMARVDFLLDRASGALLVSEVNSLPGFTESSMFPRLWEASGLPYAALLDRLIELALERHRRRAALETTYRRG